MSTPVLLRMLLLLTVTSIAHGETAPIFPTPVRESLPELVLERCDDCHGVPYPDVMTKEGWRRTIAEMYAYILGAGTLVADPQAEIKAVLDYYVARAPEGMPLAVDDTLPTKLTFTKRAVGLQPINPRPQITNIRTTDLDQDGYDDAVITENELNRITWLRWDEKSSDFVETVLAEAPAPVRSHIVDFDRDGDLDVIVAAMGYMHPNDEMIGEVHLLRNRGDQTFEQYVVMKDNARVADAQTSDVDGDGDLDIVISQFGWRTTGGFAWLENTGDPTQPFPFHDVQRVNGAMQLVMQPAGYFGLVTQQHESILRFRNVGGQYDITPLARVTNPVFGSSGIEPVDLDNDGDTDLLYTNGDMMDDDPVPKPYHGARWFENLGPGYGFRLRDLAKIPGAYCAKSADMDGDGDLDIVVSSLYFHWEDADFPSLLWLENDGEENFAKRRIAYAPSNLASFDLGDFNRDGRPDILAGGMHVPGKMDRKGRLTLWTLETPEP